MKITLFSDFFRNKTEGKVVLYIRGAMSEMKGDKELYRFSEKALLWELTKIVINISLINIFSLNSNPKI